MMKADCRISCDKCRALNRVPQARLSDSPKCGRCRRPLFSGAVLELADSNFQQLLDAGTQPLLVMFWAPWCGYCQQTRPAFRQAAGSLEPALRLASLNAEQHKNTASRMTVSGLPCFILFKNGQEVARQAGAMTAEQITAWARAHI